MFKVLKLNIYVSIQTVLSEGENYFQFFFSILDICEIFEIIIRYLYWIYIQYFSIFKMKKELK